MFEDGQSTKQPREKNPRENANYLSIISFFFTRDIFIKGFKKELVEDDIYDTLRAYKSKELGNRLETAWQAELHKREPSLFRLLLRSYGIEYLIYGIIQFVVRTPIMVIRPKAIKNLVAYFSPKPGKEVLTRQQALYYSGIIIACILVQTIYNHTYMLCLQQMALRVRISLCSLVYRKCLKLGSFTVDEITNGKIVTLISKDVREFETLILTVHDVWIGVIHIIILTYMMYTQVGIAAIVGVAVLLMFVPPQIWLGRKTTQRRLKTAVRTDHRLRIIQEILSSVQIIKMYTWEKYFTGMTNAYRRSEIRNLKILFYLKSIISSIGDISTKLSLYFCIIIYSKLTDHVLVERVYMVVTCYLTMRAVTTRAIPTVISSSAEVKSSIKRLQSFLLSEEVPSEKNEYEIAETKEPSIFFKNVSLNVLGVTLLKSINLELDRSLLGLVGPVGSGKTAFIKLLLNEVTPSEGKIEVNGTISYASQEPWIFPGSIRQNILFGDGYLSGRYKKVIEVCALTKDLDSFPNGDNTIVNDRGLSLSKGQQARINLARALYKEADIYLLDNPLSALDSQVSNHVFENSIKDFLSDKFCILVTNKVQYLKEIGNILVIKDGGIKHFGSYEELETHEKVFTNKYERGKLETESIYDAGKDTTEFIDDDDEKAKLLEATKATHEADNIYYETKKEGKVSFTVYKTYLKCAGYCWVGLLLLTHISAQAGNSGFEFFIKFWMDTEGEHFKIQNNMTNTSSIDKVLARKSKIPLYFTALALYLTVTVVVKYLVLFTLTTKVSEALHRISFSNIIKAPMKFFDQYLAGNIVNRFSKDFGTIDEYIPIVIEILLQNFFMFLGTLMVMLILNKLFFILTCILALLSGIVRTLYLPTSRRLKRLDGTTRSPVIGHIKTSLEGLTTIRTNGLQNLAKNQFDKHQDLHSSTDYMFITTDRAFGFFLDMLCSLYISSIILTCVLVLEGPSAGTVGLVISNALGIISVLQWTIRQWAEIENQMTSVERVLEYTEVQTEPTTGKEIKDWPSDGKVTYDSVFLRYPKTKQLVLKNVTFTVNPQEQICIIGRTGAGKTSIISTLFRLYDTEMGKISIDNCDTNDLKLDYLRSRISIIPQNPALFSGTLRTNLDPYEIYSDADLWRALEHVNIKRLKNFECDLHSSVSNRGSNLSAGQRQLICLARALLSKNKILVLDEATSEMDNETNAVIENVIKTKFSHCTIMTIVHRVSSVMTYDKVMVVHDGTIIEFDDPKMLITNKDSVFYKLLAQEGFKPH